MRGTPALLLALLLPLALCDPPPLVDAAPPLHSPARMHPLPPDLPPPGPHPADVPARPGLSALEQARSRANPARSPYPADAGADSGADTAPGDHPSEDDSVQADHPAPSRRESNTTDAESPLHAAPHGPVRCADGVCVELGAELLATVEGDQCRSLFVNGKCPVSCAQRLGGVLANTTWPACAAACGNDVVAGAAERWREICERRQESLIDQGKEVVKGLVGDGLKTRIAWRGVLRFLLALGILVVGVGYGYRKGSGAAQYAYRLQKRRLMGRKNSDHDLPV